MQRSFHAAVTDRRLSVIVPTREHPDDFRRLLQSISAQSVLPAEVIVVDGGVATVEAIAKEVWPFAVRYEHVYPPCLAKQQNVGIRALNASSTLVAFVDDDIVFEPEAMEQMMAYWRRAPATVGGAVFNLVNHTDPPRHVWLKSLFGLDSNRRGILLSSGYNTRIGAVDRTMDVEWLFGGATVWRRSIVEEAGFDEWFEGPGALYELDICFRIGDRYRMVAVAEARAEEVLAGRSWADIPLGRWQILNRLYLVRKYQGHRGVSLQRCWVALVGHLALNLSRGIFARDRRYLKRAYGNCIGIYEAVTSRSRSGAPTSPPARTSG